MPVCSLFLVAREGRGKVMCLENMTEPLAHLHKPFIHTHAAEAVRQTCRTRWRRTWIARYARRSHLILSMLRRVRYTESVAGLSLSYACWLLHPVATRDLAIARLLASVHGTSYENWTRHVHWARYADNTRWQRRYFCKHWGRMPSSMYAQLELQTLASTRVVLNTTTNVCLFLNGNHADCISLGALRAVHAKGINVDIVGTSSTLARVAEKTARLKGGQWICTQRMRSWTGLPCSTFACAHERDAGCCSACRWWMGKKAC